MRTLTYKEFQEINNKTKAKYTDKNTKYGKIGRLSKIDFKNDTCMIDYDGLPTKTQLSKLVYAISKGYVCISNPSILDNYKGFRTLTDTDYKAIQILQKHMGLTEDDAKLVIVYQAQYNYFNTIDSFIEKRGCEFLLKDKDETALRFIIPFLNDKEQIANQICDYNNSLLAGNKKDGYVEIILLKGDF